MSNYLDVKDFHHKFDLPAPAKPRQLDPDMFRYRQKFLEEELAELIEAWRNNDLAGQADALVDLVYVALGTAIFMGLPWQKLWDEVQRANMDKVKGQDAEGATLRHALDVVKPEGWKPPQMERIIDEHLA